VPPSIEAPLRLQDAKAWTTPPRVGELEQRMLGADTLLLGQLLWNRGFRSSAEARDFLETDRVSLGDPFCMRGVGPAVDRVLRATQHGELIVVYGDYDVDGVAGAALLSRALTRMGSQVRVHVPDRARDGYGVHAEAVRALAAEGARVIITVDCGISANDQIALAAELGTDVVVTDHHTIPAQLPAAAAVLNPHHPDCGYPFKDLAGGGVALQLARALLSVTLPASEVDDQVRGLLPFAALSTVADVVPLLGENRSIVVGGLDGARRGLVPGLDALCQSAGRSQLRLSARDLAFAVIPRLNAASRMGNARDALNLLLADDEGAAQPIAAGLEIANDARRARMNELLEVAEEEARSRAADGAIVLDGEYPVGLAGLLAARLADRFDMPCVVIERGEETSRGSVRGGRVHLVQALEECATDLVQFGGHERAAGFSLHSSSIDAFRRAFVAAVERRGATSAEGKEPEPAYDADCALRLESVGNRLAALVERFEPIGAANPGPTFISRNVHVRSADYVRGGHIKMRLAQGMARRKGIAFRPTFEPPARGSVVDLLYTVERSVWAGEERVELFVRDVRAVRNP